MENVQMKKSQIHDTASMANKVANELDTYADRISCLLGHRLAQLLDGDTGQHISNARYFALEKASSLSTEGYQFRNFCQELSDFQEYAWKKDQAVASEMNTLANAHKPPLTIYSVANAGKCLLFSLFCVKAPSFVSSLYPDIDTAFHWLRDKSMDYNHWKENTKEYFTHGEGQYLKNEIDAMYDAVKDFFVAISALVIGGTLGPVGLAAGIALITGTMFKAAAISSNDTKALRAYRMGRKDLAHYYYSTESLHDWAEKTDKGGVVENYHNQVATECTDVVTHTAKTVCQVLALEQGIEKLAEVRGLDGSTVVGHDYSFNNIKKNFIRGFYENQTESGVNYDYVEKNGISELVKNKHTNINDFLLRGPRKDWENLTSEETLDIVKPCVKISKFIYHTVTCTGETTMEQVKQYSDIFSGTSDMDLWERITLVNDTLLSGPMDAYTKKYVGPIHDIIDPLHDMMTAD